MSLLDESLAISTELDMRPFDGAGSVVKGVDGQRKCPAKPKSTEGVTMQQRNGR